MPNGKLICGTLGIDRIQALALPKMSEQDAKSPEPIAEETEAMVEPEAAVEPPPEASEPRRSEPSSSRSGVLVWLALLLALAALALAAWPRFEAQWGKSEADGESELRELASRVETLASGQSAAERERRDESARIDADLDAIRSGLADAVARIEQSRALAAESDPVVSARLSEIEGRMDRAQEREAEVQRSMARFAEQLSERSDQQRDVDRDLALKLDLIEASALLGIGQALAESGQNRAAALLAYRRAETRLSAQPDSRLNQARERLAEEIDRIDSQSEPDWSGARARLMRWSTSVEDWPTLQPADGGPGGAEPGETEAESGWWSSVTRSLGQLVEVEHRGEELIDAPPVDALREAARLHLAAAGLAVERRDAEALRPHLSALADLLDRYFATDQAPLGPVRSELDELLALEAPAVPSDLGQARAALQRVIEAL